MKIYVASSWRNEYQPKIIMKLRDSGFEVYDFRNPYYPEYPDNIELGFKWEEIDPNWLKWSFKEYDNALYDERAWEGYMRDFNAMKQADACVMILPCGKSAHLEAGWMKGNGKYVSIYFPKDEKFEPELMYRLVDYISMDLSFIISELKKYEGKLHDRSISNNSKRE